MSKIPTFHRVLPLVLLIIVVVGFGSLAFGIGKRQKVILQLPWKHQFQFAGYYAALEKGYYSKEGLDVEIRQADIGVSPLEEVLKGEVQFGIGNTEIIVSYMEGKPIVVLASILQHSPSILIMKSSMGITQPSHLIGKKIMLNEFSNGIDLIAMLYNEGIKRDQFEIVNTSLSLNDLLNDRVQAYHGYVSNEPFFMEKFGIPFNTISPSDFGIDFYSDCLFTSKNEVEKNYEIVKKFRAASLKGWEYALMNKDEIAQLILSRYNQTKTLDHLLYEALELEKLISPEFIEIGHSNRERWLRTAEFLYQLGIIKRMKNIDDFIYKPNPKIYVPWLQIFIISFLTLLLLSIAYILIKKWLLQAVKQNNKQLDQVNMELQAKRDELRQVSTQLSNSNIDLDKRFKETSTFFNAITSDLKNPLEELMQIIEKLGLGKHHSANDEKLIALAREQGNSILYLIGEFQEFSENEKLNSIFYCKMDTEFEMKRISSSIANIFTSQALFVSPPEVIIPFPEFIVEKEKVIRVLDLISHFLLEQLKPLGFQLHSIQEDPSTLLFTIYTKSENLTEQAVALIDQLHEAQLKFPFNATSFPIYIAKKLVKAVNGNLWSETNTKGEVVVNLRVPCIAIEGSNVSALSSVPMQLGVSLSSVMKLANKTFLVFDNQLDGYSLIRTMLNGCSSKLIYSSSLATMAGISSSFPEIDLVIMSINVFSTSVADCLSSIRSKAPSVPIIGLIAFDFENHQLQTQLQFRKVIKKPVSQPQLLMAISECLP
jgi:ABC-type nitrate/sulfonate/bicarbonate transport system substrate-binding protein/CheY-like chemotaxis protein